VKRKARSLAAMLSFDCLIHLPSAKSFWCESLQQMDDLTLRTGWISYWGNDDRHWVWLRWAQSARKPPSVHLPILQAMEVR